MHRMKEICTIEKQACFENSTNNSKMCIDIVHYNDDHGYFAIHNFHSCVVQFAEYRKSYYGDYVIDNKPLDLTEDELLILLNQSFKNSIFTRSFVDKLISILSSEETSAIASNTPIRSHLGASTIAESSIFIKELGEKYSIEKVLVKDTCVHKIRFALYYTNQYGFFQICLGPLRVSEDVLLSLLTEACKINLFSHVFKLALSESMSRFN